MFVYTFVYFVRTFITFILWKQYCNVDTPLSGLDKVYKGVGLDWLSATLHKICWDSSQFQQISHSKHLLSFFFDDLLLLKTTLWITTFQALLKSISSWVCFLPFAGKHRSRTVRNPFYIDRSQNIVQYGIFSSLRFFV